MNTGDKMLGCNLRLTSIPSRGISNTPSRFMLQKLWYTVSTILARKQTCHFNAFKFKTSLLQACYGGNKYFPSLFLKLAFLPFQSNKYFISSFACNNILNDVSFLQAEEEMRQRVALIAKIRAIESVPVIRFKVLPFYWYLYCTCK